MKYILSFGGGVNSTALYFYIKEKKLPLDLIIFADTGVEHKYTYELIERFKKMIDVEFTTVKSPLAENLYEYYKQIKRLPSFMKRDCTWKFKIYPLRRYLRTRYGKKERFGLYMGITYDEALRVKKSNVKYIDNLYPFVDDKITRQGNIEILRKVGIEAKKSGCVGCIYNKKSEWTNMLKNDKELFMKYEELDKNNLRYPEISLIVGSTLENFRLAIEQQSEMNFESREPSCDVMGGCFL
jgi:hypothetical protein